MNNVRREASRHFRNKKWEYLKERISELDSGTINKNTRYMYKGAAEIN
jgi:hypothetical protein